MNDLSQRDRELVALGAAMGSNCVPCVEFHIPESRKAGLGDGEIHAAILHADRIRQVPARKTLQAALKLLPAPAGEPGATETAAGCGNAVAAAETEAGRTGQPRDMMQRMMSHMMDMCGRRQSAAAPDSAQTQPAAAAATGTGCGCG